ncbi:NAD(P)-dependent oxidoreductase [Stieleria varia]|uniref:D-3-phosphoglycerate dehydrogenase n=1 Tax=Stieleria varia TaxID=2528005 RepID=A0A5C6B1J0_9BACT|nr:NAD(P)-dependent oxidoreductase [Stieleria varia]TWU04294.1 D-3-phosphoglycerate dehydrogenase [Stieleria varia]
MSTDDITIERVAVPAISFAQVPVLVAHLRSIYPDARVNTQCVPRHHSTRDTIEYLRDCDAAIVSFEPINAEVLAALPRLKVVSKLGVGLDTIDPVAMRKHNVRLGWTPGVNKRSVAELALCLTLAALKHVVAANVDMRAGKRPLQRVGRQLTGRVVGIHGCGEIGQDFIRLLKPFGCHVIACDLRDRSEFYHEFDVESVSPAALYARSEVLSIHMNVTPMNRGLYNADVLDQLRPDCVLVNTSRGTLVDEVALRERLKRRQIAAAAFDVFEHEPPEDDELLNLDNFIATPHIGSGSMEARLQMGMAAIQGLTHHFLPQPGEYPFECYT